MAITQNQPPKRFYIIRRLTPVECGRLQGFADNWADIDQLADMSDDEAVFWRQVYSTDRAIKGLKPSSAVLTKKQSLIKWHNSLQTEAATYKMWGNGMAKPNAKHFVSRAFEVIRQRRAGRTDDEIDVDGRVCDARA